MSSSRIGVLVAAALAVAAPARGQEEERRVASTIEVSEEVRDSLESEETLEWSEYWEDLPEDERPSLEEDTPAEDPENPEVTPETVTPLSLPGDQEASAVTPQALSLPEAEGSIQGMGESFSPILSSGTATYSVPIAIPAGRAGVQPTFALGYSSTGGNSILGFGWGLEAPYISRMTDRGVPRYRDHELWSGEEDRFFYNGGQELVPVSDASVAALDLGAGVPPEYRGWQQYRARVEGAFMRFFRSPDLRRWAVQSPDGSLMEFGELPAGELPEDFGSSSSALESELSGGRGRIFRWFLTRMSDSHGSTVYYRYSETGGATLGDGSRYLADVHYASPVSCVPGDSEPGDPELVTALRTCTQPLALYGRRVRFVYEARPDVFSSYVAGWRVDLSRRLVRIDVSSAEGTPGQRYMVRRYHLSYYPESESFHSLLQRVQVEGRPDAMDASSASVVGVSTALSESAMDTPTLLGRTLPPLTFSYSEGLASSAMVPGFGGIWGTVTTAPASPPHSVDEGFADLFDVNSDGLPDLLVTDPARYRTSSGGPAAGVFFNGFSGSDARPATPGSFSGAVAVAVPSSRSSSFDLSNLNVVPMDIDGDGRSDLLHMPRVASYGYFLPTRNADDVIAAVSPRDQGWRFSYVPVALPAGVTDPRIDLGRDGAHVRAFDVNNDHLVDVVRTSGTVMQTWLNLGWLEGGDGRFGSATWAGSSGSAGTWTLSTLPVESCLLESGLPADFEDPEVRLADMNGDGLQDLVRVRRGRVLYWAGRGNGAFGEGPQDCGRGEGADRYIEMASPPMELNVELDGIYLDDVNEDGAADIIQVRATAIDVWFNRAGRSFTPRVIASGTPFRPAYQARIRLADVDGSGTLDVLYGNANDYRWVDLMGGVRPRVLTGVDNGLGALTTLEYGSSAEEYLRDLREASTCTSSLGTGAGGCRDRFTWSRVDSACDERIESLTGECVHRSGGAPLVVQVVTSVETTDRLNLLGREETVTRTEYRFHDGYYEGFEQEFRGFGAADAVALSIGEWDTHPTGTTRSYFHQGRRPGDIAVDRLADNPFEALKARVFLTETFDPATGRTISTGHSGYTVRRLLTGLDGRAVWFAFASTTDELRYDTSLAGGGGTAFATPFDSVRFESVGALGAVPLPTDAPDPSLPAASARTVMMRWGGTIHLASRVVRMDNQGHAIDSAALGRVGVDEAITTHAEADRLGGTSGRWLWRAGPSWTEGSAAPGVRLGETERVYDGVTGDLRLTRSFAHLPASRPDGYDFGAEWPQTNQTVLASTLFDSFGNATFSCGGADVWSMSSIEELVECLRLGEVQYDGAYSQFPETERIYTRLDSLEEPGVLETAGTWDHGLGLLLSVSDPNDFVTTVGYDGFGRVSFVRPPASGDCTTTAPVQHFLYDLTEDGASVPISIVRAFQENECGLGLSTIETLTYVDGLGRARATLSTSENAGEWIQSGVTILNSRGSVRRAFQPARLAAGGSPSASAALRISDVPFEDSGYDAFDRVVARFPAVGGIYFTTFHALSRDECDPLDHDSSSPHYRTCSTMRMDGHGRVIDQILRNRQPGILDTEYYRLLTFYRADGAVTRLVRAQTTSDTTYESAAVLGDHLVERTFTYDTAGRRIGTTDPDSDDYSSTDDRSRTWRYLFNRVGDLVAVRDPRGCGQDFFYDRAARLVAEDYVACAESSSVAYTTELTLPDDAIGLERLEMDGREIDVEYVFDRVPGWVSSSTFPDVTESLYLGRLGGVSDRGQRSVLAYDDRGQVVWTAREMAIIAESGPEPAVSTGPDGRPVVVDPPVVGATVTYDHADGHSYERTASYDHGGRPTDMTLPLDPDYSGGGTAPVIAGRLGYNARGLPRTVELAIGGVYRPIVDGLGYTRDGLVETVTYGDATLADGTSRAPTVSTTLYDDRRRPIRMRTTRTATPPPMPADPMDPRPLSAVTVPHDQMLVWDLADNLVAVEDLRMPTEWPEGFRPQSVHVTHDSLYRVAGADYEYTHDDGTRSPLDEGTDWRLEAEAVTTAGADPMDTHPAPTIGTAPETRVASMTWAYDWLGNMNEWTDDASAFYERSLGDILNGADFASHERPGSLRLAANLDPSLPSTNRGGYVEVDYGRDGNVLAMTVHAECGDLGTNTCLVPAIGDESTRRDALHASCTCAEEQHYTYAWDEVNRIAEARRFDREGGSWSLAVRQRYLYDSANQRTVKETITPPDGELPELDRVALYVFPGDFERRGLEVSAGTYADAGDAETQYVVGGARVVWRSNARAETLALEREQRVTIALTDLIQNTTTVFDLLSGEIVETGGYYANGARETYRTNADGIAMEPMGFTGKEADEEVGLTYFGARYLAARLSRWTSPDPVHTHSLGGGEALNAYHYIGGNLLAARDPIGLDYLLTGGVVADADDPDGAMMRIDNAEARERAWADWNNGLEADERNLFELEVLADGRGRITTSDAGDAMLAACTADPANCGVRAGVLESLTQAASDTDHVHIMPVPVFNDLDDPRIEANYRGAPDAPRLEYRPDGTATTVIEWLGAQGPNHWIFGRTAPAGLGAELPGAPDDEIVIYATRFPSMAPAEPIPEAWCENMANPRLRMRRSEDYADFVERLGAQVLRHEVEQHANNDVPGHGGRAIEAERLAGRAYRGHAAAGTLVDPAGEAGP